MRVARSRVTRRGTSSRTSTSPPSSAATSKRRTGSATTPTSSRPTPQKNTIFAFARTASVALGSVPAAISAWHHGQRLRLWVTGGWRGGRASSARAASRHRRRAPADHSVRPAGGRRDPHCRRRGVDGRRGADLQARRDLAVLNSTDSELSLATRSDRYTTCSLISKTART